MAEENHMPNTACGVRARRGEAARPHHRVNEQAARARLRPASGACPTFG
ncbi:MAG: hypothetical protein HY259_02575 [Chloroflexi bacterium]|nr:hypothetical protein [Chloroflexota bacterium]